MMEGRRHRVARLELGALFIWPAVLCSVAEDKVNVETDFLWTARWAGGRAGAGSAAVVTPLTSPLLKVGSGPSGPSAGGTPDSPVRSVSGLRLSYDAPLPRRRFGRVVVGLFSCRCVRYGTLHNTCSSYVTDFSSHTFVVL